MTLATAGTVVAADGLGATPAFLGFRPSSGCGLSVRLLDSVSAWQASDSDWVRLTHGHPLHSQAWLKSWWEELGAQTGQLAIAEIRDFDSVIGFAPLFVERTWKGTTLRFLGSGTACTDYLDIFCSKANARPVAQALGLWLDSSDCRKQLGSIDLIELEGHQANAPGVTALQDALAQTGWSEEITPLHSCWVVDLPATWDELLSKLSHRGRRRARTALKNIDSGAMSFHIWDQHDDIVAHWPVFVELHQNRRHQKGEPGCFAEGPFEQFLRRAAFRLAADQQASLVCVRSQEKWIAAALQLHGPSTRFLYQTGMDADAIKLEPGHAINALLLHFNQLQGITQFDFLRGNEPYKARWNAQPIPLVRTRLWHPRLTAQVRARMLAVGRSVKQWLQNDSPTNGHEKD